MTLIRLLVVCFQVNHGIDDDEGGLGNANHFLIAVASASGVLPEK